MGRYLETDPMGLDAGINVYGYVQGNPLMLVDARGLDCGVASDASGTNASLANLWDYVEGHPVQSALMALGAASGVGMPEDMAIGGAEAAADAGAEVAADAASGASSTGRGLSDLGGVFTSETNSAGGTVWTSDGVISQNDIAPLVNSGMYKGEVNIISGVHGFVDGTTTVDSSLYEADLARFGNLPGVNVFNFSELSPGGISSLLKGPGTTIGGFCDSGACLAPFK